MKETGKKGKDEEREQGREEKIDENKGREGRRE